MCGPAWPAGHGPLTPYRGRGSAGSPHENFLISLRLQLHDLQTARYCFSNTSQYNAGMGKKPLALRIDEGLLERVDAARGDVPRTRWVERALESALVERDLIGPYKLPPSEPSPKPAVPKSREGSSRKPPAPVQTVIRPGSPHSVPGVRPAREFVLDPRQAALNKAKKS
jgi:hypothetical protein